MISGFVSKQHFQVEYSLVEYQKISYAGFNGKKILNWFITKY